MYNVVHVMQWPLANSPWEEAEKIPDVMEGLPGREGGGEGRGMRSGGA